MKQKGGSCERVFSADGLLCITLLELELQIRYNGFGSRITSPTTTLSTAGRKNKF